MATTTTVSSNYSGSPSLIVGAAFKEADTLRLGLVTEAPNVNYKMNLRKIAYTNGTVDYSCGHAPAGAITLSEKVLTIEKVKNDFDVCKEDFRATWSDPSMGGSAANPNAPADIMEAIAVELLASQAEKIDTDIWTGLAATSGEFNGLIAQFAADGSVIKANNGITALGAATTEANVEAHLKAALAAIPASLRRKDLVVAVSSNVFQAYNFYLISKGIAWNGSTEDKVAAFGRYKITEVNGLPDDTIVCYEKKNIVFAYGQSEDMMNLELVDEDAIGLLTGQVRGRLVYGAAVGYYNSAEIVWLLTTTA